MRSECCTLSTVAIAVKPGRTHPQDRVCTIPESPLRNRYPLPALPSSPAPAARHVLAHRRVRVETPERVAIGYDLADIGSRFAALLLDTIVLALALAVLWIGIPWFAGWLGLRSARVATLGIALISLVSFAFIWGYFVFFEGLREGQTPGKKVLGIRVIRDGGFSISLSAAAIRNLVRIVDIQPVPASLIGVGMMLLHPETKRLGDLAAGTLVVRERTMARLPEEEDAGGGNVPAGAPTLTDEQFAALAQYVARRGALEAGVRDRIAGRLAATLTADGEAQPSAGGADASLVALHSGEAARRVGDSPSGSARAAGLVRRQRERWSDFQELVRRAERRGLRRMPEADVSRFAALYRETAADLARARSYGASPALLYTLERWTGAGHNLLYRPATRSWRQARRWLGGGFPALVRRRWRPVAAAAAFFYLPALLSFAAIRAEPARARAALPAAIIARAELGAERERAGQEYAEVPELFMPVMASGIIANNVQVTFLAFAGGVLAGAGTVLILVFNGVFLGGVAGLFANEGLSMYLWSFVLPHGVIELTAIVVAGGAGLWLGSAFLLPGRLKRREALVARGRDAVLLLAGTTVLLVVAGTIEGFVSPAPLPREVKLLAAAVFAGALAVYLLFAGRTADPLDSAAGDPRVTGAPAASPRDTG